MLNCLRKQLMLSANLFNVCRTGEISNFIKKKCICLFNRSGSYFTLLTFVVEVMTTCSEREIPDSLDLAPWLCCSDSRSSPLRQGLEFSHHHTSFQFGEHGDDIWPHSLWRCRQPFTAKKSVKDWDKKKKSDYFEPELWFSHCLQYCNQS